MKAPAGFIRVAGPDDATSWDGQPLPPDVEVILVDDFADPESGWRPASPDDADLRCRQRTRHPRCRGTVVAVLMRTHDDRRGRRLVRWGYCGDHLYGRHLVDGQLVGARLRRTSA